MIARPVGARLVSDACAAQWWDLTPAQYQNLPAGWPIAGYWFTDPSWPIGLVFLPNPATPWETDAFTPGVY